MAGSRTTSNQEMATSEPLPPLPPAPADATPTDITIAPSHDLYFPESANHIGSVMFPPVDEGGARALVQLNPPIIDLWAGAVSYWPEILGGLLALLAVICLWRIVRVLRRKREAGAWHCRRCNYNLTGLPRGADGASGQRCPECGVDLQRRRPVLGRRTRRRIAPALAVLSLAAIGYAAMHLAGVSRWGPAQQWLSIPSIRAYELSQKPGFGWVRGRANGEQIVEVDLTTGRVTRRLPLRRSLGWMPAVLSPDGERIAVSGGEGRVQLLSARSGRVVARMRHDHLRLGVRGRNIAGFSADGESVYIAFAAGDPPRERLIRWDWRTGEQETVIETELWEEMTRNQGRMRYVRQYQLAGTGNDLRFFALPSWEGSEWREDNAVRAHGPNGVLAVSRALKAFASPSGVAVSPDGEYVFHAQGMYQPLVRGHLETGATRELAATAPPEPTGAGAAIDQSGRLLAAPSRYFDEQQRAIVHRAWLLYDLREDRWIARLPHDPEYGAGQPVFSPDGRWFAFVAHATLPGTRRGVRRVVIYDLAPLQEHLARPDNPR